MTRGAASAAFVAIAVLAAAPAAAHRLDEYLQAIRVDVGESIRLELDVTPGASLAPEVVAALDPDGNGAIDRVDADSYVAALMKAIAVAIDGRSARLDLVSQDFPDTEQLSAGAGVIRLVVAAGAPRSRGDHRIDVLNSFEPGASVYLANALRPASSAVTIRSQTRDPQQRRLTIEYWMSAAPFDTTSASWTLGAALLLGCSAWWRRPKRAT